MDKIPCRVSADLRNHEAQTEVAVAFDEWDDDLMHDICGTRLAKPVQEILKTLSQIEVTENSFGSKAVNTALALEALLPDIRALRQACIDEWRDQ